MVLPIAPEDVDSEESMHLMNWITNRLVRSMYYEIDSEMLLNEYYLSYGGSSIKEISFTGLKSNFLSAAAGLVARFCPNLQAVYCMNCVVSKSICGLLNSCVYLNHLELDLSDAAKSLKAATVRACSCPSLVSMLLICDKRTRTDVIAALITLSDNLERLSLEKHPELFQVDVWDEQTFGMKFFLDKPLPKLTSLAIVPADIFKDSLTSFPFEKFVTLCPNLVNFDVSGALRVSNGCIVRAAEQLKFLRRVSLVGTEVEDEGLHALATHCHNTLEEAYLNNCYGGISSAGINHFMSTCHLTGFGLPHSNDFLDNINSVDFLPFQHLLILCLGSEALSPASARHIAQYCVNLQMLDCFVSYDSSPTEISTAIECFLIKCTHLFTVNYTVEKYFNPHPSLNPTIADGTLAQWEEIYPEVDVTNDKNSRTFDVLNVDMSRVVKK